MTRSITPSDLSAMDRFTRAHLVNSLSGFKSFSLIATTDAQGKHNLAAFSNIVHLGADPALIAFINRPREAAPHTLRNIEQTKWYTVNHVQESFMEKAHQTSAKYPDGVNEFEACGLEMEFVDAVPVPYVKESVVKYALELVEVVPIRHNGTFMVIGALRHAIIPEDAVEEDGFIALDKAGSLCSLGIDGYFRTQRIVRLPYAKP